MTLRAPHQDATLTSEEAEVEGRSPGRRWWIQHPGWVSIDAGY